MADWAAWGTRRVSFKTTQQECRLCTSSRAPGPPLLVLCLRLFFMHGTAHAPRSVRGLEAPHRADVATLSSGTPHLPRLEGGDDRILDPCGGVADQ
jgi:hypothetical protein